MDFNNKNSFKGYELKHISAADIQNEMEKFVQNLRPGSPHLRSIRVTSAYPKDFKLSFGQTSCLSTTLDLIVEHLKQIPEPSQETPRPSQETPRAALVHQPRQRIVRVVDLLKIQEIWNSKLSQSLLKHQVFHDSFPIIRSVTQAFPYKFFIKCPKCGKELLVTITFNATEGTHSQPHYRFYCFTSHVIKCMKQ